MSLTLKSSAEVHIRPDKRVNRKAAHFLKLNFVRTIPVVQEIYMNLNIVLDMFTDLNMPVDGCSWGSTHVHSFDTKATETSLFVTVCVHSSTKVVLSEADALALVDLPAMDAAIDKYIVDAGETVKRNKVLEQVDSEAKQLVTWMRNTAIDAAKESLNYDARVKALEDEFKAVLAIKYYAVVASLEAEAASSDTPWHPEAVAKAKAAAYLNIPTSVKSIFSRHEIKFAEDKKAA